MDLDLKGRIAVITGCSVGIGREIAKVLASEQVQTVVIARREHLLATLNDEIVQSGGLRPLSIKMDLYNRASPLKIQEIVKQTYGYTDILVNNAGGSRAMPWNSTDDLWDESFAINFTAVRKMTQTFLPDMIKRQWGRIICITGSAEPDGINAAYAAKAGVHSWAKGLSREMGKYGITVNCLAPGRIHSEQIDTRVHPTKKEQFDFASRNIPLGYLGEPTDLAYLVAFLCSPKARYITGERIYVDGGMHRAY